MTKAWRPEAVLFMRGIVSHPTKSVTLGPKSRRSALARALVRDGMLRLEHYVPGRRLVTYRATAAGEAEFPPYDLPARAAQGTQES